MRKHEGLKQFPCEECGSLSLLKKVKISITKLFLSQIKKKSKILYLQASCSVQRRLDYFKFNLCAPVGICNTVNDVL